MQSQEKEKEKNTNELCETQDFREPGITNNGQGTINRTELFRELDERRDKGYAKMMENLEAIRHALIQWNPINCTSKENDSATKKIKKKSKSPNKNHTRNLSRRRTQKHLQKKFGSTIIQKSQKPAQKGLPN